MSTELLNQILGLATLGAQIFLVIGTIYALSMRKKPQDSIIQFFAKHAYLFSFLIALVSLVGSLYYSDVIGYAPCILCWYQRIAIYPLVFMLPLAMLKKEKVLTDYLLTLTIVGTTVSLYHNYITYGGSELFACATTGASCTQRYVFELGYITIPLMTLTAFALVIFLLLLDKYFSTSSSPRK